MWPLTSHERKALLFVVGMLLLGFAVRFSLRYNSFKEFYGSGAFVKEEGAPAFVLLNTASRRDLMRVKGIGSVLAERIISYRRGHGPFKSMEGLLNVKGIGPKKLRSFRKKLLIKP